MLPVRVLTQQQDAIRREQAQSIWLTLSVRRTSGTKLARFGFKPAGRTLSIQRSISFTAASRMPTKIWSGFVHACLTYRMPLMSLHF